MVKEMSLQVPPNVTQCLKRRGWVDLCFLFPKGETPRDLNSKVSVRTRIRVDTLPVISYLLGGLASREVRKGKIPMFSKSVEIVRSLLPGLNLLLTT